MKNRVYSANKIKETAEKVDGTLALPANATSLEKFRFNIQPEFVKYKLEEGIAGDELPPGLKLIRLK